MAWMARLGTACFSSRSLICSRKAFRNTRGAMYQAQERARKAFAEVGVRIEWHTGRPPSTQPERDPSIVVRLAEHTPADYLPGALAFARVYEGVHVTVFWGPHRASAPLCGAGRGTRARAGPRDHAYPPRSRSAFREWCDEITVERRRPSRDGKQTASLYSAGCGTDSARPRVTEGHRSEGRREFGTSEDYKLSRVRAASALFTVVREACPLLSCVLGGCRCSSRPAHT